MKKPTKHQFGSFRVHSDQKSTDDLLCRQDYKNPFASPLQKVGALDADERSQDLNNVNLTAEQVANLSVEQIIAMSKKEPTKSMVPAYSDPQLPASQASHMRLTPQANHANNEDAFLKETNPVIVQKQPVA